MSDKNDKTSQVDLIKQIFDLLKCTEDITMHFIQEALEDIKVFDKKQHDYGPRNISDFGELGVLVRSNDKMSRLKNLLQKPAPFTFDPAKFTDEELEEMMRESQKPKSVQMIKDPKPCTVDQVLPANESIEDSWRDLSVYGVIARLVRKGVWPR